jgi:hypothetical protein
MKHKYNHAQYISDRRKAHGARVSARGADPFPDAPGYRGAVSEEEKSEVGK